MSRNVAASSVRTSLTRRVSSGVIVVHWGTGTTPPAVLGDPVLGAFDLDGGDGAVAGAGQVTAADRHLGAEPCRQVVGGPALPEGLGGVDDGELTTTEP